jgi:putative holliday junction resolvase
MSSTFLGFDFGTKNIGVAVGQSVTKTATALPIIRVTKNNHWKNAIDKLITDWHPTALIVGIPMNTEGNKQEMTKTVHSFAQQLKNFFNLPVHEVNECLTTKTAREEIYSQGGYKALKKEPIDSIAAKLILESWMRTAD